MRDFADGVQFLMVGGIGLAFVILSFSSKVTPSTKLYHRVIGVAIGLGLICMAVVEP
jgi:hypothetical protein